MPTSPDTLLRLVRSTPEPRDHFPEALGVDDWAIRMGRNYGTILVNLEAHRPIDLLPERSADALSNWLKNHPRVKVITRDRSNEYARGASEGAPEAIQVADRWHLAKNLREALETFLEQNRACLRAAAEKQTEPVAPKLPETLEKIDPMSSDQAKSSINHVQSVRKPTKIEARRLIQREKRLERYQKVIVLHQQSVGIRAIARQLDLGRDTVRKFIRAGEFPEISQRRKTANKITPYLDYLEKRWN
jgi:transposase